MNGVAYRFRVSQGGGGAPVPVSAWVPMWLHWPGAEKLHSPSADSSSDEWLISCAS